MKKILSLLFFMFLVGLGMHAQETAKSIMEQKKKASDSLEIVSRFDDNLIVDSEQLKARFEANEKKRAEIRQMIEDSSLKERQKEKLRHDLVYNPFSARLKKFVKEQRFKRGKGISELAGTVEK